MHSSSEKNQAKRQTIVKVVLLIIVIAITVLIVALGWSRFKKDSPVKQTAQTQGQTTTTPTNTPQPQTTPKPAEQPKAPVTTWPVKLSMSEAASTTVVVNKKHQLPSAYVPAGLVAYGAGQIKSEAAQALTKLFSAAQEQGFTLKLISGYRSYDSQKAVYIGYVNRDGQAAADTYSARPGFSEHQTGLAADIGSTSCDLDTCFGDTLVGQWVAANAQNYGFIIRYPKGKELETGYQYEPWHLRYLGVQTAQAVYTSGKTLDQYYNVPAGGYE